MGIKEQKRNDYNGFVDKFKPKKTTDDCYTPPAIYEVIKKYVHENFLNLKGYKIARPFYPGGNYQKEAESYDDKTIVIDNPPFSISAEVELFYLEKGIKFFLFRNGLTALNPAHSKKMYTIITGKQIVFENGAKVMTAFCTNLRNPGILVDGGLGEQIEKAGSISAPEKKKLRKHEYPKNLLTIGKLMNVGRNGGNFEISHKSTHRIGTLDEQRGKGLSIFGNGYLITDKKAEELELTLRDLALRKLKIKPDKERENDDYYFWSLSEREKEIVATLNAKETN